MTLDTIRLSRKIFPIVTLLGGLFLAQSAHAGDILQKILSTGEVVIGYRKSAMPFSFLSSTNKPVGYSIDLCLNVVQDMRERLNRPDLTVRYQEVDGTSRITEVRNRRVDLECGSTTITRKRLQNVQFSYAFFAGGTKLMIKSTNTAKSAHDLKGKTVAVDVNTTTADAVQYYSNLNRLALKIVSAKNRNEAFELLKTDKVQAFASDDALLWGYANSSPNPRDFKIIPPNFDVQPYGIGHPRNDPEFTRLIDSSLVKQFRNGIAAKTYKKWFQDGQNVKTPFPMSRVMRDAIARPSKASVL